VANPEHVARILSSTYQPAAGVLDCSGADFSGANLQGKNLRGINFKGAIFYHANLESADFSGADLEGVAFSNSNCAKARFEEAKLISARIGNTILQEACFPHATVNDIRIMGSDLKGAHFYEVLFDKGFDFSYCELNDAKFVNCSMDTATFFGCGLRGTNFQYSLLHNANFDLQILDHVDFQGAKLNGASFRGATLIIDSIFAADFANTDLTDANFRKCYFKHVNFEGANWERCNFEYAEFEEGNLSGLKNADRAKNLHTVRATGFRQNLEFSEISWLNRRFNWEWVRTFGRLPLFTASTTALILLPIFFYFLDAYNRYVDYMQTAITANGNNSSIVSEFAKLPHLPMPSLSLISFVSAILLLFASSIYLLACPQRVKQFGKVEWCDQLGRSLTEYLPSAWRHPKWRAICIVLYVLGGGLAAYVITVKLSKTLLYVWNATEFTAPW
jgi:uncharacterized protein YjbI with pentapeptide repeats